MRFEIFSRRGWFGTKWYWRLRARNGEIVAQSQAYTRRASARATCARIIEELVHGSQLGDRSIVDVVD